jgi:hypothetical protein
MYLPGHVVQVVYASSTAAWSSATTGSWVSTGFSAAITPTSTSSAILVTISLATGQSTSAWGTNWGIQRNGTQIGGGASLYGAFSRSWISTDSYQSNNQLYGLSASHLDSPASTSTLTYLLTYYGEGNTGYLNRAVTADSAISNATGFSSITLMEIAQ